MAEMMRRVYEVDPLLCPAFFAAIFLFLTPIISRI
jgi:hypothetical protein